jgi:hypothetical protein
MNLKYSNRLDNVINVKYSMHLNSNLSIISSHRRSSVKFGWKIEGPEVVKVSTVSNHMFYNSLWPERTVFITQITVS